MTLKVLDPMGVSLPGHGSRQAGEAFDLPADVARQYAQDYPDRFALDPDTTACPPPRRVPAESGATRQADGGHGHAGLEAINGIGPETVAALRAAGITSLEQLIAADAADLAKRLDGSSVRQVRDWQRQASKLLKE